MTFKDLQDQLRAHIRARISRGEMTGVSLSRAADFPQGHLSNFLNGRRGLSLESMDRLLDSLRLGVLDLVDAKEMRARAALPKVRDAVERIAMVSAEHAALARFAPNQILETRSFNKSFLRRLKLRYAEDRRDWLRFVLIRIPAKHTYLFPSGSASAILLIDRHYSSLEPYRRLQPNVYAVRLGGRCVMGYVSLFNGCLILRPRNPQEQVEIVEIASGRSFAEHIVGRVCHVGLEV